MREPHREGIANPLKSIVDSAESDREHVWKLQAREPGDHARGKRTGRVEKDIKAVPLVAGQCFQPCRI